MHESLQRLFAYVQKKTASTDEPVHEMSELRERLKVSTAVFTNWKQRGVSKEGALAAEELWGCSPNWVLSGGGLPVAMICWPFPNITPEQITSLSAGDIETVEKVALSLVGRLKAPQPETLSSSNNVFTADEHGNLSAQLPLETKRGRTGGKHSAVEAKRAQK